MWSLEPRSDLSRVAASAAHLAAIGLLVWFQELGARLRREEHRAWWAGTGRDLLNAAGLAAIALSLLGAGWPGPAALVAGVTETLLVFGIYTYASTRTALAHRRAAAIAGGLLVCLPALVFPAEVVGLLGEAARSLFPGLG
ncbi:MAG TPA: hypothetical protein VH880_05780 [Anaeromyxobacteraceae bacterium]|jgi:hypothetical protein